MKLYRSGLWMFVLTVFLSSLVFAQKPSSVPRDQWGAPAVKVSHVKGEWIIAGKKNKVVLNESDFSMKIQAGSVTWKMVPSAKDDMQVKFKGELFNLRLADAGKIEMAPYDTGFKTGVKIRLEQFRSTGLLNKGLELDLALVLTVALEGNTEELVYDAAAIERQASVRQLDWPKELETKNVDYSVLNHVRGNLLPCNWSKGYHPFRYVPGLGEKSNTGDKTSIIQANHIECWSMSWWGFLKGKSAMMLIVETSADASYKFAHHPGGPTVLGPRWLASLGKLRYPRSVRMCFFPKGGYVTLAKRYRRYVKDKGQFVSLKEKIARKPIVAKLIGAAHLRPYVMLQKRTFTAIPALSYDMYKSTHAEPAENGQVSVMTFDELAGQLRELKADGVDNCHVVLCAWTNRGYDMGHPDPLPPAPEAGGWAGYRRYIDTCNELGYTYVNDDQYRDYYTASHSYDPQFAIHEETTTGRPMIFPGTRFEKFWKEGHIAVMNYWAGGDNTYLNATFGLGHLRKNYELMSRNGVEMNGVFFDVMGYVPPTEDFNPEHPQTRSDCMKSRALMFNWTRNNLGIVGTEDGADWVVPYVDYSSVANEGACISVPTYNLVYHDAIITQAGSFQNPLRCILNAGYVQIDAMYDKQITLTVCALQKRVGLLEMTNHEFLGKKYKKERTTFSDGTTVTIDRDAGTYEIKPALPGDVLSSGRIK